MMRCIDDDHGDLLLMRRQEDEIMERRRNPRPVHVHFVGFRGDEYLSAVRVWGKPDFIHLIHDRRMYGDVGANDVLVFGPKADPAKISEYCDQDHERH